MKLTGRRIRAARVVRGLTLNELGKAIGVRKNTVQDYEAGRTRPPVDRVIAIAETLEVAPLWILGCDGSATSYVGLNELIERVMERLEEFYTRVGVKDCP